MNSRKQKMLRGKQSVISVEWRDVLMDRLMNKCKPSSQAYELIDSSWDTEYFGIRAAKVILNDMVNKDEVEMIKRFVFGYDFITITNVGNCPENNYWLACETDAFQTNINIQFFKKLPRVSPKGTFHTEVFEAYPRNERILEIASKAFKYSRFLNDPWLNPDKAKKIYAHWVNNAFDKAGRYFVIAKNHEETVGFMLFSIDQKTLSARIELIAIDEIHRGNSVGKSLIYKMELFIKQKGINLIMVGTQLDNLSAHSFYNSCGFKLVNYNSIYHYWPFK